MTALSRRSVIQGASALAIATILPKTVAFGSPLPIPVGNRLSFRVIRKGDDIGHHTLTFQPEGDNLTVQIDVDIAVTFAGIAFYHYTHQATETWQQGDVVLIRAVTNNDGKKSTVTVQRETDGLHVEASHIQSYVAPSNAMLLTHWNKRMLDGPIINTQDGRLMHPIVADKGSATIPTKSGKTLSAEHYVLSGDFAVETWYDATSRWSGFSFQADDGTAVTYVLDA